MNVVYGTSAGLSTAGNQLFYPWLLGGGDVNWAGFGWALATGNLDGQHGDDLMIGAPYDRGTGDSSAGAVYTMYSVPGGLSAASSKRWSQESLVGYGLSSYPICSEFHGDGDAFGARPSSGRLQQRSSGRSGGLGAGKEPHGQRLA